MTIIHQIITIGAVVAGTVVTRFLPFILFPEHKKPPVFIKYLGTVLPAAVIGLLVIYCFKNTSFFTEYHGLPEIIAVVSIIFLYLWKGNMLVCILGGTVIYMFLVQFIFI